MLQKLDTFFKSAAILTSIIAVVLFLLPIDILAQSSTSVTLNWTATGDDGSSGTATSYDIRYSSSIISETNWDAATQIDNEPVPQIAGSSESVTINDLQPSSTYYFAIKACDDGSNWSPMSNVISKSTSAETTPPGLIADLGTSNPTQTSILLNWTAPGDDGYSGTASQYDVRYSTSPISAANFFSATPINGEPVPQIAGSDESMTVNGLTQNTEYYFAMRAADEGPNWSDVSNSPSGSTTNESTAPAAIANLAASNPSDTSVRLTWTATGDDGSVGTASQYEIRYSTSLITEANWNSAALVGSVPAPQASGTSEQFDVIGLNQEVTYYFAVKASDEVPNWSALSNVASSTTIDLTPPAAIMDLSAITGDDDGTIVLGWTAPGDDGMNGSAGLYEIRFSQNEINDSNWFDASLNTTPLLPLAAGEYQSFTLTGLTPGQLYYTAIKTYDNSGNQSLISNVDSAEAGFDLVTDINDTESDLPTDFELSQNYPNPFNPTTTISFSLPEQSYVDLSIYNVNGQKITTLVDQNLHAGVHTFEWDGNSVSGNQVATGIYIYRIQANSYTDSKKMVLMK